MFFKILPSTIMLSVLTRALAGGGGGGPSPDPSANCVPATNPLITIVGGCIPGTANLRVEPVYGTCAGIGASQKACFDTLGEGFDFDFSVISCEEVADPVLGPVSAVTFSIDDLANGAGYPGGEITSCDPAVDPDIEAFAEYLESIGLLGIVGATMMVCPTSATCPSRFDEPGSRRQLMGRAFDGTESEMMDMLEKCGQYDYEAFLHVKDHLYGLVVPGPEAMANDCPFIASHAVFSQDETIPPRKELKVWTYQDDFEDAFPQHGSMSFGNFRGHDVFAAFVNAEAGNPDVPIYDVVQNNCGNFIVSLADNLGVRIDDRVTAFVARRLIENAGQKFVASIRDSVYFPSIFPEGRRLGSGTQEEAVVTALVENTAAELII